jgi:hypothetical protein
VEKNSSKHSLKYSVKIGDAMLKVNEKSELFVVWFSLILHFKIKCLDKSVMGKICFFVSFLKKNRLVFYLLKRFKRIAKKITRVNLI